MEEFRLSIRHLINEMNKIKWIKWDENEMNQMISWNVLNGMDLHKCNTLNEMDWIESIELN